jgi:hypothetical protein
MSNCSIEVNKDIIHFDRCELNNAFWDLVAITNITSQSTLVDYEESGRRYLSQLGLKSRLVAGTTGSWWQQIPLVEQ